MCIIIKYVGKFGNSCFQGPTHQHLGVGTLEDFGPSIQWRGELTAGYRWTGWGSTLHENCTLL